MKTLRWLAIVTLVAGASLVACGDDDEDNAGGSSGSGGGATGGTGGGETGGTGGGETGGTGGGETGGTGGGETGGTGGGATGGSAGEAGGAGAAGAGGGISTCVTDCIEGNPAAWKALVDLMAPCVCEPGICDDVCETSFCTDPIDYEPPAECANCALSKGQTDCSGELIACLGDSEVCGPFVTDCLMPCSSQ